MGVPSLYQELWQPSLTPQWIPVDTLCVYMQHLHLEIPCLLLSMLTRANFNFTTNFAL